MLETFAFRRHMVLVFELLGINLYRYTRREDYKGIPKDTLRKLAT